MNKSYMVFSSIAMEFSLVQAIKKWSIITSVNTKIKIFYLN